MLLPNDQGPFSPTDHNILVEDKGPCTPPRPPPLHLSADHTGNTFTPSDQLVFLPESELTKAVSVYTTQLWASNDPSKMAQDISEMLNFSVCMTWAAGVGWGGGGAR